MSGPDDIIASSNQGAEQQVVTVSTEAEGATPRHSRWHKIRVRALKTVAFVLLGLVAFLLAVILGINTGPGRRFVADQIAGLEFQNGMRISVARIDGSLYGKMVLRGLSVRDLRGEFLYSPEIRVDWRPFAYLDNHVDVRSARPSGSSCAALRNFERRRPVMLLCCPTSTSTSATCA